MFIDLKLQLYFLLLVRRTFVARRRRLILFVVCFKIYVQALSISPIRFDTYLKATFFRTKEFRALMEVEVIRE